MNKSAVEWLVQELQSFYLGRSEFGYSEIVARAKSMEQEQQQDYYEKGYDRGRIEGYGEGYHEGMYDGENK